MYVDFDRETARARIRGVAEGAAQGAGNGAVGAAVAAGRGYRDADREETPRRDASRRDRQAPIAVQERADSFEDLDARPLDLADGSADPAPTPAPEASDRAAPEPQPSAGSTPQPTAAAAVRLEPPLMRRIVYLATSRPGETPPFARTQTHLEKEGLRHGIGRFTQASGSLGALLTLYRRRDPEAFERIFGADAELPEADPAELLQVTTAPDTGADATPRLQPVGGRPLSDPAWIRRFKAAAQHVPFQDMQFRMAAETSLVPILPFARHLGLATERGLALLTERVLELGLGPAREFIIAAAGPINSDALRHAALERVAADPNRATLAEFQEAAGVDEPPGHFGPRSHAALVGALRGLGDGPIALPSPQMMGDRIVEAAERSNLPGLAAEVWRKANLGDAPLSEDQPIME